MANVKPKILPWLCLNPKTQLFLLSPITKNLDSFPTSFHNIHIPLSLFPNNNISNKPSPPSHFHNSYISLPFLVYQTPHKVISHLLTPKSLFLIPFIPFRGVYNLNPCKHGHMGRPKRLELLRFPRLT